MQKQLNETTGFRKFFKRLTKFCFYFALFCFGIYLVTWVIADRIIERHKLDIDDIMSLDGIENNSKENSW